MLLALPYHMKNILRFGYLSGWRKGEIFGLRWDKNYDEVGRCHKNIRQQEW
jgi:integrase